jgi:hypothetical protein
VEKEKGEDVHVVSMNVMIVKANKDRYTQNAVKQFAVWL